MTLNKTVIGFLVSLATLAAGAQAQTFGWSANTKVVYVDIKEDYIEFKLDLTQPQSSCPDRYVLSIPETSENYEAGISTLLTALTSQNDAIYFMQTDFTGCLTPVQRVRLLR